MKQLFFLIAWCFSYLIIAQGNQSIKIIDGKFYDPLTNNRFISKGVNFVVDLYSFDNGVTFEYKPHHGYFPSNAATCFGQPNCDIEINNSFSFLKNNLGINTIRLMVDAGAPTSPDCNGTTFTINFFNSPDVRQKVNYTNVDFLAPYYNQILNIAGNNGLKVILVFPGNGSDCDNSPINTIYESLIAAIATQCKNNTALLAYDLWNEPQYSQRVYSLKKSQICEMSNRRYNILKTVDPNHLVSIGFIAIDAERYSPDVFKADFFAWHIYPPLVRLSHEETWLDQNQQPYQVTVLDQNLKYNQLNHYLNGFNTILKWIKNNCNKPFLIGETGFRARLTNEIDIRMDGDLDTQVQYFNQTFQNTLNVGGLGYVWWQAYDVSWGLPQDPGEDDWGPFDPNYSTNTINPKPLANAFLNFNQYQTTSTTVVYPANYTNLYGHAGTQFNGSVTNDLGEQVADAVVTGWHLQQNADDINKIDWKYVSQTLTQADGTYQLYSVTPIDLVPNYSQTEINHIRAAAVFANSVECDSYVNSLPSSYCNNITFQLTKQQLTDVDLNNQIIFNGYLNAYSASNNLTFNNSFVDFAVPIPSGSTGQTSTFVAGREIAITGESHVSGPYDNSFYIDFNPDCTDNTYTLRQENSGTENKKSKQNDIVSSSEVENKLSQNNIKTIFLNYDNDILSTQAKVYPNPLNTDILNVDCELGITQLSLYNAMSQQVFSQSFDGNIQKNSLNLSTLISGLYTLHIILPNGNKSIHQLIIQ